MMMQDDLKKQPSEEHQCLQDGDTEASCRRVVEVWSCMRPWSPVGAPTLLIC